MLQPGHYISWGEWWGRPLSSLRNTSSLLLCAHPANFSGKRPDLSLAGLGLWKCGTNFRSLRVQDACLPTDLPLLAVNISDAVGQRIGSQQRGGALRPVHGHQRVLAHQNLAHVLSACHPDQGAAQEVGFEHIAVLLPSWCVEAWTLKRQIQGRREDQQVALNCKKHYHCFFLDSWTKPEFLIALRSFEIVVLTLFPKTAFISEELYVSHSLVIFWLSSNVHHHLFFMPLHSKK